MLRVVISRHPMKCYESHMSLASIHGHGRPGWGELLRSGPRQKRKIDYDPDPRQNRFCLPRAPEQKQWRQSYQETNLIKLGTVYGH